MRTTDLNMNPNCFRLENSLCVAAVHGGENRPSNQYSPTRRSGATRGPTCSMQPAVRQQWAGYVCMYPMQHVAGETGSRVRFVKNMNIHQSWWNMGHE